MLSIDALNERFAIPDVARFEAGRGGLTRLAVTAPAADGHVYLHGAHVAHYQPRGHGPVLFLSNKSFFETGKAIRGGVPVIFPWFGPRDGDGAAMHGFVRTRPWEVRAVRREGDAVVASFSIASDDQTRAIWPNDFEIFFDVSFGRSLAMQLNVRNTSSQAITFEEALHTYFAVGDVRTIALEGLGGAEFVDKNVDYRRSTQEEAILKLAGPVDRVYLNTAATCIISDPVNHRRITVEKTNSNATVVWNPWSDRIVSLADLDAQLWPNFLCVETCNVREHAITLPAGGVHSMGATITSQPA
jgi:glucose-6-phosphate 1-epimerase